MKTLYLGIRRIRKINCSRIVSLPKIWLLHHGIEDGGTLTCTLNDEGDLILSPILNSKEKMNIRYLERAELGGTPSPGHQPDHQEGDLS